MRKIISTLIFLNLLHINSNAQEANVKISNAEMEPINKTVGELLIPNAFTPNGDGNNDVFKVLNFTNQKLLEFKVFNRWGSVLFKTTNPQEGWDGFYKNIAQPLGLYGYVIRIVYPEGVEETYKGTVTLIR